MFINMVKSDRLWEYGPHRTIAGSGEPLDSDFDDDFRLRLLWLWLTHDSDSNGDFHQGCQTVSHYGH